MTGESQIEPVSIPTVEQVCDARTRLLALTSRRLVQFVDARRDALRLLERGAKDGGADVAGAIAVLKKTTVLK